MYNNIVMDVGKELRDHALIAFCLWPEEQNKRQQAWAITQIKENAGQAIVVPF